METKERITTYLDGFEDDYHTLSSALDKRKRGHLACCSSQLCDFETGIDTRHNGRNKGRTDQRCNESRMHHFIYHCGTNMRRMVEAVVRSCEDAASLLVAQEHGGDYMYADIIRLPLSVV